MYTPETLTLDELINERGREFAWEGWRRQDLVRWDKFAKGSWTFMMRKIRQAKVQIEAAMFWVIMALILVVFAVVPGAADLCARLLGIYSTPNFLFLFMIFLLIVKAFGMTIQLSQLESKQRELIQKMALEQKFLEEKEAELEEREAALETCGKGE